MPCKQLKFHVYVVHTHGIATAYALLYYTMHHTTRLCKNKCPVSHPLSKVSSPFLPIKGLEDTACMACVPQWYHQILIDAGGTSDNTGSHKYSKPNIWI